ncbi:MAG: redoxin domain-containing protein [Alphaproteobacteria bacterium]|nr:redoxin domain-containing protein [Alphaproteobacteria bacterium]
MTKTTTTTRTVFAALAAALWLWGAAPARADVAIGQPAPDFTATDSHGQTVHLSDYKGKTVVLEWTSSECPFVHKFYDSGNMQKFQKMATASGAIWLSVDSSAVGNPGYMSGDEADKWMKEHRAAQTRILIDKTGAIGHLYGAKVTPHMFVIDPEGKLAYAGGIDSIPSTDPSDIDKAENYVMEAIVSIAEGQPVPVTQSRPYGCGVKY